MNWTWRFKQWRKERQKIRHLRRFIRTQEKKYAPRIGDDLEEAIEVGALDDFFNETYDAQTEINRIRTKYLTNKAKNMGLELDSAKPDWYWTGETQDGRSYKVLSNVGEAQLRLMIRKHQRETIEWWLKVITGLTGLIGTIIGLIAILKK